jgi:hypothetical protein
MLPVLNEIDLATAPVELNMPVVNVNPANANVPLVNVAVPIAVNEKAAPNVVVPDVLLIVKFTNVAFPLPMIVPVPTKVGVKLVNVPLVLKVRLFKFNAVAAIVNAVVPKSSLLNQLPVVNVIILVPLPVNVTFGDIVVLPPVVPKTNILVTEASVVKPPVPVYVKPVAVVICNTVWPADVCANTILVVPKSIERVFELFELNIPTVKVKPPNDNDPLVNVAVPVATIENADPNVVAAA